ncbi:uncharacterized protein LY89DRAFT_689579 [Mollisia scopiformis]|uniref:Uncharacterized protein n=1 Tax=Mollisia scopiformis TaxID=149040 RepID=A0A132BCY4_MOLSC|nr:uncharacterized protein LY89DRAFT_689579 [Mollisia scopiformis]KUJ10292.1 hypothetical protein LY89DRAFT_689579 [Mollisia scopiformis]
MGQIPCTTQQQATCGDPYIVESRYGTVRHISNMVAAQAPKTLPGEHSHLPQTIPPFWSHSRCNLGAAVVPLDGFVRRHSARVRAVACRPRLDFRAGRSLAWPSIARSSLLLSQWVYIIVSIVHQSPC